MGALLSIPLAGGLTTIGSSCLAGLTFCFTSTAASMFCKSCNCNSSTATRIGFAFIFLFNSMLAWAMRSRFAINLIEKWSYDYIKMDCEDGKCYGVLAVHRICFALSLFHVLLGASLIGVKDTRDKRSAIQNGWWGPKVLLWLVLIAISFFIPNGFFMVWGNYISLMGATLFILLGLVLLVDFAHSWSETCLENWENSFNSNLWQWILIGSTAGIESEIGSRSKQHSRRILYVPHYVRIVLGAAFTFIAIAYSTSRAATQSRALVGKNKKGSGAVSLPIDDGSLGDHGLVTAQPGRTESPRYQALLAAVEAGAIPASALNEGDDDDLDDDDEIVGDDRDDEKSGTRYNYAWFHCIFAIGAMYVAMLLTDWNVVKASPIDGPSNPDEDVYIGRSEVAMWMRVVSSWVCMLLYIWSLIAPVLLPDRFGDF
ncbi:TMS membrane tumor differentially [Pyrrhoderma noxium]|uniref:TMS membrane tumor differentially n=1 Tax=Pyrrhoderma noxium TaxID=2282107 RepID=A0A286U969_9AGAM|nr:TMS membrane tumor differentially [Pyrrhoderma noxium]